MDGQRTFAHRPATLKVPQTGAQQMSQLLKSDSRSSSRNRTTIWIGTWESWNRKPVWTHECYLLHQLYWKKCVVEKSTARWRESITKTKATKAFHILNLFFFRLSVKKIIRLLLFTFTNALNMFLFPFAHFTWSSVFHTDVRDFHHSRYVTRYSTRLAVKSSVNLLRICCLWLYVDGIGTCQQAEFRFSVKKTIEKIVRRLSPWSQENLLQPQQLSLSK